MISRLNGKIISITDKTIVIDVGGIGFLVYATSDTLTRTKQGETINLFTYMAVRENAIELYGFSDENELSFFEMLIGISGIGPKSALGILAVAPADTMRRAIASGDMSYMTKISGIGKKTAEKIVIELRDKLQKQGHINNKEEFREELDVLEALKSLGYSQQEARDALKEISPDITDTGAKVKEALKILGGK